jgi:hypothetical protein
MPARHDPDGTPNTPFRDEHVTIGDLVDCCQALAGTAMRCCGPVAD